MLRRPVHEMSQLESPDAAVTDVVFPLLYGDFKQFAIIDRVGATISVLPVLLGANQRPDATSGFWLYARTGSDVLIPDAFRALKVEAA